MKNYRVTAHDYVRYLIVRLLTLSPVVSLLHENKVVNGPIEAGLNFKFLATFLFVPNQKN